MSPVVVITRTQPGADALAQRLAAFGYDARIAPALVPAPTHTACPCAPSDVAAVAVTSVHTFQFFKPASWTGKTLYAVGTATAQAARAAGFQNAVCGAGDITALANTITRDPPAGTLLYIGAEEPAPATLPALAGTGVPVLIWPVYRTAAAPVVPPPAGAVVTLHSVRGAHVFADAVRAYAPELQLTLLCLSPAVLESVSALPCKAAYVAAQPNENALTELLRTVCPPEPACRSR